MSKLRKISLRELVDSVRTTTLNKKDTAEKFNLTVEELNYILETKKIKALNLTFPRKSRNFIIIDDLENENISNQSNSSEHEENNEELTTVSYSQEDIF